MPGRRFDWRWIVLIVIVAIIANGAQLPWLVLFLALAGGGGYLLYLGWQVWGGGAFSSKRVTYWRGQRIETPAQRRRGLPPLRAIGPALLYLIIGGALVLTALAVLLRQFGVYI
jgi:hypothetical protein